MHGVERRDRIGQSSGVNPQQPPADIRSDQPAKRKYFGLLKASIENGFASIDVGL
jgi:hypothetical protein